MTSDDVIKGVAEELANFFGDQGLGNAYMSTARALAAAGLLADAPPPEPLPDQQVRLDPEGWAWQRMSEGEWAATMWASVRKDDDVRGWPVLVPETDLDEARQRRMDAEDMLMRMESDLDDLRAERDSLPAELDQMTTWHSGRIRHNAARAELDRRAKAGEL